MKRKIMVGLITMAITGLLWGCYPFPNTDIAKSDLDIVITNFQEDIDFLKYSTYVLYDSVPLIIGEDEGADSDDPFYQNGYDLDILNEIEKQMNALGYTRIQSVQFPDLGVAATAFRILDVDVTSFPGWWWGYPGYGWWGGGYNPGYFPGWYNSFYTYQQGTIVLDMEDLQKTQSDTSLVWNGVINGLVDQNSTTSSDRITRAVESAFKQSRNFYPREEE